MAYTTKLIDAQKMHALHPATFWAPSRSALDSISVGDAVKICRNNERFWVCVTEVSDEVITGTVDNLLCNNRFSVGRVVKLSPSNVFDIDKPR